MEQPVKYVPVNLPQPFIDAHLTEAPSTGFHTAIGNYLGTDVVPAQNGEQTNQKKYIQKYRPVCRFMRCKDYLNELIVCNRLRGSYFTEPPPWSDKVRWKKGDPGFCVYGFAYSQLMNPLDLTQPAVLFCSWKKWMGQDQPEDWSHRLEALIHDINAVQPDDWMPVRLHPTQDESILVVKADKNYLHPPLLSALLILLRQSALKDDDWRSSSSTSLSDTATLATIPGINKNIFQKLQGVDEKLGKWWFQVLVENAESLVPRDDSIEEAAGLPEKKWPGRFTETYHNYSGCVGVLGNAVLYDVKDPAWRNPETGIVGINPYYTDKAFEGPIVWSHRLREAVNG